MKPFVILKSSFSACNCLIICSYVIKAFFLLCSTSFYVMKQQKSKPSLLLLEWMMDSGIKYKLGKFYILLLSVFIIALKII